MNVNRDTMLFENLTDFDAMRLRVATEELVQTGHIDPDARYFFEVWRASLGFDDRQGLRLTASLNSGKIRQGVRMSTGLSRFFIESSKDIPGWTEEHNTALVDLMNNHDSVFWEAWIWGFRTGYRKGVVLVSIAPEDLPGPLKSRVVPVSRQTEFVTVCKSRVAGETPRKKTMALVDELPDAKYITAVLYHKDVLAEDSDRSTECDWEVVAVLCQVDEEEPMTPATMMSNHFKADGGTATLMSPETFEAELRKAYNYWKNRAMGITKEEWNEDNGN